MHEERQYSKNLGQKSQYVDTYTPELLDPIPRQLGRNTITDCAFGQFHGYDLWTGYELSWLNQKGKPMVAVAEFKVPCTSPNLIESKSFKLYLNSLNQTRFDTQSQLLSVLEKDLSQAAGAPVDVTLFQVDEALICQRQTEYLCLDDLDIEINTYNYDENMLEGHVTPERVIEERLCSHLLKSNCLVTHQPDWGSVYIHYKGPAIHHETLLKYIIAFRDHHEFHEQCVERIFSDITRCCQPEQLTVFARYTRRGGLDINPFRSNFQSHITVHREFRQ